MLLYDTRRYRISISGNTSRCLKNDKLLTHCLVISVWQKFPDFQNLLWALSPSSHEDLDKTTRERISFTKPDMKSKVRTKIFPVIVLKWLTETLRPAALSRVCLKIINCIIARKSWFRQLNRFMESSPSASETKSYSLKKETDWRANLACPTAQSADSTNIFSVSLINWKRAELRWN